MTGRRRKRLADGKPYNGGHGRMTKAMEQKLADHYGLAIQQSSKLAQGIVDRFLHVKKRIFLLDLDEDDGVILMEKNCRAAFLHNIKQNNPEAQHALCPQGRDSWCSFQQDKYLPLEKRTDAVKNVKRLDSVSAKALFLFTILKVHILSRFFWKS
jgi:hypothetical protein